MTAANRQTIYPARRAIERARTTAGAQPIRLFPQLLPVWRAEIRATIEDSEPYEVFDAFLTRGIAHGALTTPQALATFFGIQRSIVDRALTFLTTLRHVHRDGDNLTLTDLGQRSVRDGVRYVVKQDRRHLYFDGFTAAPLPASHYTGVTYLQAQRWRGPEGLEFRAIGYHAPFDVAQVPQLLRRPDRRDLNIPDGLRDATVISVQQEWLPAYLVQDAGPVGLQVFSMAAEGRDRHLERICAHLREALQEEKDHTDPTTAWQKWLANRGYPGVGIHRTPGGALRAILPAKAFTGDSAAFKLYQLGSFETSQRAFLQLWCTDTALRRSAVLDRVLTMVRTRRINSRADLDDYLGQHSLLLDVASPSAADLLRYASQRGDAEAASMIDALR
jgi:hypothetical protein